jgi:nucleoporin NUP82
MLPSLNDMAAKEAERKKHLGESGLGLSQAFQFGERSNQEYALRVELAASKLNLIIIIGAPR